MHRSNKKRFFDFPEYPGGSEAFKKFIRDNLKYPARAIEAGIEGTVHLSYRVDGNGTVTDIQVLHGIGMGCDEEAIRLIGMARFGKAKNPGYKVTTIFKAKIVFQLPRVKLRYSIKPAIDSTKKIEYKITLPNNISRKNE